MSNNNQNTTYGTLREITSLVSKVTDTNDTSSIKSLSNQLAQNIINKHS